MTLSQLTGHVICITQQYYTYAISIVKIHIEYTVYVNNNDTCTHENFPTVKIMLYKRI